MKTFHQHWFLIALLLLFLYCAYKSYQAAAQAIAFFAAVWKLFKLFGGGAGFGLKSALGVTAVINVFILVFMLACAFVPSLWSWITGLLSGTPAPNDNGANYSTTTNGVPLQITGLNSPSVSE